MHPLQRMALLRLVDVSYRRPWVPLAVAGVVAAVAVAMASQLGFKGDFVELLPQKTPEVADLKYVEKQSGGSGYLVLQVKGGTKDERRAFAAAWAPEMEARRELIVYVEYRFPTSFFADRALLTLTPERLTELEADLAARIAWEKKVANPLYVDLGEDEPPPDFEALIAKYRGDAPTGEYVESKDGTELYLYAKPAHSAADLDFDREVLAAAKEVTAKVLPGFPGLAVDYTGVYVARVEEDDQMQADIARAATLSLVLALGIIFLASRRPVALVVVAAPVLIGIAATFGFAWVIIGHLNPVTGFLGAVLIGLGIEYGVHLSMRFWEERRTHEPLQAMQEAMLGTFGGAMSSALTNAAAFFVVVFAEFEAFKQFGKIASFGVLATVIAAYGLGPAVLFIAERIRPSRTGEPLPAPAPDRAVERRQASPALIGVLVAVLGAAAYSLSVAPKVGFETDLKKLKGESPATELDEHITRQLGVVMMPALALVPTLEDARVVSEIAAQVRAETGARASFSTIASLNDLVPWNPEPRLAVIARIRKLVEDLPKSVTEGARAEDVKRFLKMTEAQPWTVDDVPLEIRRRFTPREGQGTFVLIFPRYAGYDVQELGWWSDDLSLVIARAKARGVETHILDSNRIAAKIFSLIKQDGPLILGLAAVVVFAMIWVALRRLRYAALVAGPLYLGMTCIFGGMHLFDVRLNFLNVVVLPNLLAIAVDNSVHLFHRYREEGPGTLGHIMRTTGFAAVIATFSNAAGYGAMLVARHEGLRSVGVLAVLGVLCTFIGTTIFFPSLLAVLERRKLQRPAPTP
jgi:predicted RND superfamily exporter protein